MKSYIGTLDFSESNKTAITIGKFDGVHIGHRILLDKILIKKHVGFKPCVFTFDNPPASVLSGKQTKVITSTHEKQEIMKDIGIELFIACPFEPSVLNMEPEVFIEKILVEKLNVGYIAVGPDCRFGHERRGDYDLLKKYQERYGYVVEKIDKMCYQGEEISSTLIRKEIENGNLEKVTHMLGRAYSIEGEVSFGKQLGRKLDFPTANILPEHNKILPPYGVYVSLVSYENRIYQGITNIGKRPTVSNDDQVSIETYIDEFEQQIYGKKIKIGLLHFRRQEIKFNDIQQLKEKIQEDVIYGRKYFQKLVRSENIDRLL